jgi:hypothetical protein
VKKSKTKTMKTKTRQARSSAGLTRSTTGKSSG